MQRQLRLDYRIQELQAEETGSVVFGHSEKLVEEVDIVPEDLEVGMYQCPKERP